MTRFTPVFIPGLLCTADLFSAQLDRFSPVYQTLQVADTTQDDSIADMAMRALSMTDGMLVPVGLSMGGYVAMEMARCAPDRMAGMALMNTTCRIDSAAHRKQREQAINLAQSDRFKGVTRHLLPRLLSPDAVNDPHIANRVLKMADDIGRQTFIQQQTAILGRVDQKDTLRGFDHPMLILCGTLDVLTPPSLSAEMAALCPHADYSLLTGIGHLSSMEAESAVINALQILFDKVDAVVDIR
ncbi:alpha/beta hydrolase [Candidatus Puniceispirillum sp.]|jgi:pimeloyl-ACP methyl ester carboxylesterase|uniref:alpha/beta fold hydrolase n=1 Tax=Candidatus Puniceispirillum sp. TaxID=2026719 RepID=UPI001EB9A94C|nr:alpha/beta hydrolase [Candidatus Puniceispirillum sp.]MBT6565915.1 alpha/beta hydrolase [Candidatus Puniceispirillum sp.]